MSERMYLQLVQQKEQGQKQARQHIRRFVAPQALRELLAPTLPLQSQVHLHIPSDAAAAGAGACALDAREATPADANEGAKDDDSAHEHRDPDEDILASRGNEQAANGRNESGTGAQRRVLTGVPMATGVQREKRLALLTKHAADTGLLLHNEIRYVWYIAMAEVRCACVDGGSFHKSRYAHTSLLLSPYNPRNCQSAMKNGHRHSSQIFPDAQHRHQIAGFNKNCAACAVCRSL